MSGSFRINSPHVVAETLDGEATIVDLDSGTYFALNESGSFIWDAILAGTTEESVASGLAGRYGIESDRAAAAVAGIVKQLREHALIVPAGEAASANGHGAAVPTVPGNGSAPAFKDPELSTYTDMQELLLLDPIHEVDEAGWPSRP
jgi:hypothetical protein